MAHKTLINGTSYEIKGGTALIDGTAFSVKSGKTLVGGTAYEVGFGSWPDDLDTGLEFISASAFTLSASSPGWDGTMEYSNGSGWRAWDGSEISSGSSESGQCIYVRGTGNTKVSGNNSWTLSGTNIENLLDYATVKAGKHPSMAQSCYKSMFNGCTGLTTAPSLPATTLADSCYSSMFKGCTGLTTAPSLPATTLANSCYSSMFNGCAGLTTAPSLPATTLVYYCYYDMFKGCTGLTTAPKLPATTLAQSCYNNMFYGCTGLTTTPSLPVTTLADSCYQHMFYGCTGLTSLPKLPATNLPYGCYQYMFYGCKNIKLSTTQTGTYTVAYRIPYSGTGTIATYSLRNMFSNTGGTFAKAPTINTTYYLDSSNTIV